jgi:hypothetical protein
MADESLSTSRNTEVQLHAFFTLKPNGGNFELTPAASPPVKMVLGTHWINSRLDPTDRLHVLPLHEQGPEATVNC